MFVLGYTVEELETAYNAQIALGVEMEQVASEAMGYPFNADDARRVAASREGMYGLAYAIRCARMAASPDVREATREAMTIHACRGIDSAMAHGIDIPALARPGGR